MDETPFDAARREVAEQEGRIARQKQMIERLDAISASAAGARQALASMKATLIILREDVSRLSSER